MNEIIKKQLSQVRPGILPYFDDNTTELIIKKSNGDFNSDLTLNKSYIIQFENYIVNPPPNFDLHINWNGGVVPKYKCMKCTVISVMGKMVKIEGNAFDLDTDTDINYIWAGWCPRKSIKIIKYL